MKQLLPILLALPLAACVADEEVGHEDFESHSWGSYHWARTSSSFDLRVVNSLTNEAPNNWGDHFAGAIVDWSDSTVLNMVGETGDTSNKTRRRCKADPGTIRICNLAYGNTGWLGIAGISIDSNGHIDSGYTKLNDTYFSAGSYYDTADWKRSVTCQELGHNVGLGHQDEDFNNQTLLSCMDYQDPPFPFPNAHDYEQLETIYASHTDSYDSYATAGGGGGGGGGGDDGGGGCNAPPGKGCNKSGTAWGTSYGRSGNIELFIRPTGNGGLEIMKVLWAE